MNLTSCARVAGVGRESRGITVGSRRGEGSFNGLSGRRLTRLRLLEALTCLRQGPVCGRRQAASRPTAGRRGCGRLRAQVASLGLAA